jgi:D-lactate dehydrogenase
LWKYNDQAFFTQEAISTICETTINSISELAAGQPLSNEIKPQAP